MVKFLDLTGLTHFWSKVKAYIDGAVSAAKTTVGNYTINGQKISTNPTILGNVTNDAQVKRSEMGVKNGVATLNENGKVPSSQLPMFMDDALEFDNEVTDSSSLKVSIGSVKSVVRVVYFRDKDKFFGQKDALSNEYYTAWGESDKIRGSEAYGTTVAGQGVTPKDGVIYVNLGNAKNYRYGGPSAKLVASGSDLALGETSSTAFAGDRGKALETWKASLADKYALTLGDSGDVTPSETAIDINFDYFDVNNPATSGSQSVSIPAATTSKAGVMSKSDKSKLDGLSNTPNATDTVAGKVKLGSGTVQTIAAQSPSTESGKTYPIQKNSSDQLVVNVPWQNTPGADTKVTQKATSSNGTFNILLAQTAENTSEETGSVNKAPGLTYNPSTKALSTGGALTASGAVTGSSIKKSGGTSSQILMADGSVATSIQTGDIDALFS